MGRPGDEQTLVTTMRKETKQTEEFVEAEYRSPTWAVSRALQQINSATRIEGEAAMSAHPFFQSRGEEIYSAVGGRRTHGSNKESLSEQEKASWLEEASTTQD